MSADNKNDTNQPILILVRRGRGGRGILVSPVDNPTDVAPCQDAQELGEVVIELMDDPNQARVDLDALMSASEEVDSETESDDSVAEQDEDEDDEDEGDEDDEEDEDDEDRPWYDIRGSADPADQILVNLLNAGMSKAQRMSNRQARKTRYRRKGGGKKRK